MSAAASEGALPPAAVAPFVRDQSTWLSYAACFYLLIVQGSLGPAMPFIRDERGISHTVAGLHFSAVALGALIASIIVMRTVRAIGRARTFWFNLVLGSAGALLFVFAPWTPLSIAGTLLIGLCGVQMVVVVQANLAERHPEHRSVALVEINVACSLGTIVAAFGVGLAQRTPFGWQLAFVGAATFMAVAGFRLRHAPFTPGRLPGAVQRAHGPLPRLFWVLCIIGALSAAGEWSIMYWGSDFLNSASSVSKGAAAALMSTFFVGMTAGRFAGSRMIRTIPAQRLLVGGFTLALCGFPIFWQAPSTPIRLLGLLLLGLGISNIFPAMSELAASMLPRMVDVAFAKIQLTGNVMILLAPFALGVLGDQFGISAAMFLVAPFIAGALLLTLWFIRQPWTELPEER
jgi:predicted MFS family arabinose efflux permease